MKPSQLALGVTLAMGAFTSIADEQIETINIVGVREQALAFEQEQVGVELVTIGREAIERAGTSDLNGILQQSIPGLTVIPKNGRYDYATYSMQGSCSQDILWLIDGIRINNRLFNGGYLDTISTAMIERIEVLKAGQSVMFGTTALAGVVNIVTRSYKGADAGQVSAGIDTLGSTQLSGYHSALIGDTEVTVFGASDRSDGYQPWEDEDIHWTATDRERGYDVQNLGVKVAQEWHKTRAQLMAQYNVADLDYLRPYYNVETQNRRDQLLVTLQLEHQINDEHQLEFKGYYHNWDTDYFRVYQYEDGSTKVVNDNDPWWFEDYGAKVTVHSQLGMHHFNYGIEHQRYYGEDAVMKFESNTEQVNDVFAQYQPQLAALPDTKLSLGGRYTQVKDGESGSALEFSARHMVNDTWGINVAAGTSFGLPSAEQLYASADDGIYGNRDLTPETGININTGLDYSRSDVQWQVNLFWREISDIIGVGTKDGKDQYVNLDKEVVTLGVDLHLFWMLTDSVSVDVATTYSDIENENGDEALLNVPDVSANIRVDYQPNNRPWELWLQSSYVGSMTAYDKGYGEYTLMDLGASYRFGPQENHRINLKLENAFDTDAVTGIFRPGSDAPADYRDTIDTLGSPRNLQISYIFDF